MLQRVTFARVLMCNWNRICPTTMECNEKKNKKTTTTATLPESKSVQVFFGLNAFKSKHFQINQLKNLAAHFGRTDFN